MEKIISIHTHLFYICVTLLFCNQYTNCAGSQTIVVVMPGLLDGGFDFLTNQQKSITKARVNHPHTSLNPSKQIHSYNKTITVYCNNIEGKKMDLGGPACVQFYKEMILDAHKKYPDENLILAGGSQGSVGPFGALLELLEENHPVTHKIKGIMIESCLASTHTTINHIISQRPLINRIPEYSPVIAPLLAEYAGVLCYPLWVFEKVKSLVCKGYRPLTDNLHITYDAFQPQMASYLNLLNTKYPDFFNTLPLLIFHSKGDPLIPYNVADHMFLCLPQHCIQFNIVNS